MSIDLKIFRQRLLQLIEAEKKYEEHRKDLLQFISSIDKKLNEEEDLKKMVGVD